MTSTRVEPKKRKRPNRQEYKFSLRVKAKLEAAGFTVIMIPMSKFRTQLIDMIVIKDAMVLPMEAKGKQAKYLKEHNARQLQMQKEAFWKSNTPFCKVTQGKLGKIEFAYYPPLGKADASAFTFAEKVIERLGIQEVQV